MCLEGLNNSEVPERESKSIELYRQIELILKTKDAVSVDVNILGRNIHSTYYGIRNYFKKQGKVNRFTYHIRPKEHKIYIKNKPRT